MGGTPADYFSDAPGLEGICVAQPLHEEAALRAQEGCYRGWKHRPGKDGENSQNEEPRDQAHGEGLGELM